MSVVPLASLLGQLAVLLWCPLDSHERHEGELRCHLALPVTGVGRAGGIVSLSRLGDGSESRRARRDQRKTRGARQFQGLPPMAACGIDFTVDTDSTTGRLVPSASFRPSSTETRWVFG